MVKAKCVNDFKTYGKKKTKASKLIRPVVNLNLSVFNITNNYFNFNLSRSGDAFDKLLGQPLNCKYSSTSRSSPYKRKFLTRQDTVSSYNSDVTPETGSSAHLFKDICKDSTSSFSFSHIPTPPIYKTINKKLVRVESSRKVKITQGGKVTKKRNKGKKLVISPRPRKCLKAVSSTPTHPHGSSLWRVNVSPILPVEMLSAPGQDHKLLAVGGIKDTPVRGQYDMSALAAGLGRLGINTSTSTQKSRRQCKEIECVWTDKNKRETEKKPMKSYNNPEHEPVKCERYETPVMFELKNSPMSNVTRRSSCRRIGWGESSSKKGISPVENVQNNSSSSRIKFIVMDEGGDHSACKNESEHESVKGERYDSPVMVGLEKCPLTNVTHRSKRRIGWVESPNKNEKVISSVINSQDDSHSANIDLIEMDKRGDSSTKNKPSDCSVMVERGNNSLMIRDDSLSNSNEDDSSEKSENSVNIKDESPSNSNEDASSEKSESSMKIKDESPSSSNEDSSSEKSENSMRIKDESPSDSNKDARSEKSENSINIKDESPSNSNECASSDKNKYSMKIKDESPSDSNKDARSEKSENSMNMKDISPSNSNEYSSSDKNEYSMKIKDESPSNSNKDARSEKSENPMRTKDESPSDSNKDSSSEKSENSMKIKDESPSNSNEDASSEKSEYSMNMKDISPSNSNEYSSSDKNEYSMKIKDESPSNSNKDARSEKSENSMNIKDESPSNSNEYANSDKNEYSMKIKDESPSSSNEDASSEKSENSMNIRDKSLSNSNEDTSSVKSEKVENIDKIEPDDDLIRNESCLSPDGKVYSPMMSKRNYSLETNKRHESAVNDDSQMETRERDDSRTKSSRLTLRPGKYWKRSLLQLRQEETRKSSISSVFSNQRRNTLDPSILAKLIEGAGHQNTSASNLSQDHNRSLDETLPILRMGAELDTITKRRGARCFRLLDVVEEELYQCTDSLLESRVENECNRSSQDLFEEEEEFFHEDFLCSGVENLEESRREVESPSCSTFLGFDTSNLFTENVRGSLIEDVKLGALAHCQQDHPLPFSEIFPDVILENCEKIGEGVFGEVFLLRRSEHELSVVKIIPVEGTQLVNNEPQKCLDEVLSEIIISEELSSLRNNPNNCTSGFCELKNKFCLQGAYPSKLVELWKEFATKKVSENDCPDMFGCDQLYIALELDHAGEPVETFKFDTAEQAFSIFLQTTFSLGIAEQVLEFEHRDLHIGNVLIKNTSEEYVSFIQNGSSFQLPTYGVKATVIDFTLSRISFEGDVLYCDLSKDPELFTAEGDYQFEIYRLMRADLQDNWRIHAPITNIRWLDYLVDKLISDKKRYKRKNLNIHKRCMNRLNKLKNIVLDFRSSSDFSEYLLESYQETVNIIKMS